MLVRFLHGLSECGRITSRRSITIRTRVFMREDWLKPCEGRSAVSAIFKRGLIRSWQRMRSVKSGGETANPR